MTASTSLESQQTEIKREIERLETYEQNCLQGLANCEQTFQENVANAPNSYDQQFKSASKAAEISTYTFLYVKSLKEDKMMELAEMEKKMVDQQESDDSSKSQNG